MSIRLYVKCGEESGSQNYHHAKWVQFIQKVLIQITQLLHTKIGWDLNGTSEAKKKSELSLIMWKWFPSEKDLPKMKTNEVFSRIQCEFGEISGSSTSKLGLILES